MLFRVATNDHPKNRIRGSRGDVSGKPTPVRPIEEEPSMDSSHVSALQLKHAGIERQLHDELSRPMPDIAVIQTLKKRKLRLKEEIVASIN